MARVTALLKPPQGSDYYKKWRWSAPNASTGVLEPLSLVGWTSLCQVRENPDSTSKLLATLTVTLGGTLGTIQIFIPGSTSWGWKWERGFYDLVLFDSVSAPYRFADGQIVIGSGTSKV